jgi:MoxR-like ATPase
LKVTEAFLRRVRPIYFEWPKPAVETAILKILAPETTEAAFAQIIEWANKIREDTRIEKKPSTPEMARLLRDIRSLLKQNLSPIELGNYITNALCPQIGDRKYLSITPIVFGVGMREAFSIGDTRI